MHEERRRQLDKGCKSVVSTPTGELSAILHRFACVVLQIETSYGSVQCIPALAKFGGGVAFQMKPFCVM